MYFLKTITIQLNIIHNMQ